MVEKWIRVGARFMDPSKTVEILNHDLLLTNIYSCYFFVSDYENYTKLPLRKIPE